MLSLRAFPLGQEPIPHPFQASRKTALADVDGGPLSYFALETA
jgi:hypothetical protein